MNFGEAIKAVRRGERIQREGWNGKNQYVELATGISYKNAAGEIVNVNHDAIGNQALAFVGTSGVQLGWLASQADMLADDWKLVKKNFHIEYDSETGIGSFFDGKVAHEITDADLFQVPNTNDFQITIRCDWMKF